MSDKYNNKNLTLCYIHPGIFARPWTCEVGYRSTELVNKRMGDLINDNNYAMFVTFPDLSKEEIKNRLHRIYNKKTIFDEIKWSSHK